MPEPPFPPDLVAFLAEPKPSAIASIRPDGSGHVADLVPDPHFTDIDRLSEHYTGRAYPQRDRGRVGAWIEVTSWHAWAVIEPWTAGRDRRVS